MTTAVNYSDLELEEDLKPRKELKLGFFTQAIGRKDQTTQELFNAIIDAAVEAERLGYETIWVGTHHFDSDFGRLASPFVVLAAIAAKTTRIRLGIAVIPLPVHDPVQLAEDAIALDLISGGRVELGVGTGGGDPVAFRGYGIEFSERERIFKEKYAVLRKLLRGEPITSPDDPEPIRVRTGGSDLWRRVWQASSREARAREVARDGDGLMLGTFFHDARTQQLVQARAYLNEWKSVHGSTKDARIYALRFVYVGKSQDHIEEIAADGVAEMKPVLDHFDPELGRYSVRDYLTRVTRYGTVEEVTNQLQNDALIASEVLTHLGPTVALSPAIGTVTAGDDLEPERLRILAEEIAPHLGWQPKK